MSKPNRALEYAVRPKTNSVGLFKVLIHRKCVKKNHRDAVQQNMRTDIRKAAVLCLVCDGL